MKKAIFIIVLAFCGCNPKNTSTRQAFAPDSINAVTDAIINESARTDATNLLGHSLEDTTGLYKCPIKIIIAKLVPSDGGNYRNVYLVYKNVGTKDVAAVKFAWKGINAFGDLADMGNALLRGYGGGFSDDGTRANHTNSGTWEILSADAKKIVKAWPIEVAFKDGTKWKIGH